MSDCHDLLTDEKNPVASLRSLLRTADLLHTCIFDPLQKNNILHLSLETQYLDKFGAEATKTALPQLFVRWIIDAT